MADFTPPHCVAAFLDHGLPPEVAPLRPVAAVWARALLAHLHLGDWDLDRVLCRSLLVACSRHGGEFSSMAPYVLRLFALWLSRVGVVSEPAALRFGRRIAHRSSLPHAMP